MSYNLQAANLTYGVEWQYIVLGDFAEINPHRAITKGTTAPFIEMAALPTHARDIEQNRITVREFSGGGAKFRNGDTLLARITPCLENGKTALVSSLAANQCAFGSTEFIVLGPKTEEDQLFLYYLARSDEFRNYAISRMEGTSGRQRVPNNAVAAYRFLCPPKSERVEIGIILGALDDRIALLRETNFTLEAIAQALFKLWFVDFDPVHARQQGRTPEGMDEATSELFPDSFEESELGLVPKGWHVERLGSICTFQKGCSYKGAGLSENEGAHMFNLGCFNAPRIFAFENIKFYTDEYKDRHTVSEGDLILANTDMTQARDILGRPLIVPAGFGSSFISHHVFKVDMSSVQKHLLRNYLFFLFGTQEFRERAVGYATGTTVLALPKDALEKHLFVLPNEGALIKFNELTGPIFNSIEHNHRQAQTLATLRDTLLSRLISGQLRLSETELEMEEACAC